MGLLQGMLRGILGVSTMAHILYHGHHGPYHGGGGAREC